MRTRIFFPLALIALTACCIARDGRSQQPGRSQQVGRSSQQPANGGQSSDNKPVLQSKTGDINSKTNEVVLPVSVRDKKGALVTNLQKSDFTLTEEGRPQTIKSLSQDSNQPFRVGLLIETNRAMSGVLEAERKAAEKFVDTLLPAQGTEAKAVEGNSQAFLIHFDREVELLQDFTDSREKLHRELDDMGATRQAQNDTQGPETTGEDRSERVHGAHGGNQLYDAIFLASDEVMAPKQQARKALIIFSDGVDRGSKDRLNEALDAAEKAHLEIFTIYFKGEQERQSFDYPERGNRRGGGWPGGGGGYPGGGGGYPGGGGGRRGGGGPSDTGVDGKKIMQQIAERTGGHAYDARKKEDLEPIYNLINDELRSQYLLTYTPDKPDTEGGFHKVALKANKDEYSVSIPEGYFAPGGDTGK